MTPPPARRTGTGGPLISITHGSFGYAGHPVVYVDHLQIMPREVVAIVGPNGSGKSTLVKGLLGLNEHLGGEVLLHGTPLGRFREHSRIGYVPQRHTLSTSVRATVREIVSVGRLTTRPWWRPAGATDREAVREALELVGLADRANSDVSTLSGGQQRRVLIARALASGAQTLLMDEPTAGVDTANQAVLATVLKRLTQRGSTMVIVTHELGPLDGVVTRLVEVSGGRVAFDGTPAEHGKLPHHDERHGEGSHHDLELGDDGGLIAGPMDGGR